MLIVLTSTRAIFLLKLLIWFLVRAGTIIVQILPNTSMVRTVLDSDAPVVGCSVHVSTRSECSKIRRQELTNFYPIQPAFN